MDFTIIDHYDLTKIGFEFSPWSTHGYLSETKRLSQAEINEMAKDNFEREMQRLKEFFRKHGIFVLIYTDSVLANPAQTFSDITTFLEPKSREPKLHLKIIHDILGRKI